MSPAVASWVAGADVPDLLQLDFLGAVRCCASSQEPRGRPGNSSAFDLWQRLASICLGMEDVVQGAVQGVVQELEIVRW